MTVQVAVRRQVFTRLAPMEVSAPLGVRSDSFKGMRTPGRLGLGGTRTGCWSILNNKSFACLTYHVIGDNASQYSVTESQLRAHLALLKNSGFVINDFEQLELAIRSG